MVVRLCLSAASILAACSAAQAPSTGSAPPELEISQPSEPPSVETESSSAQRRVAAALTKMASIRGLPELSPVAVGELSRVEMSEHIHDYIVAEVPAHVIDGQNRLLKALGVVPPDFDYLQATIRLMQHKLAGFYDPKTKRMYLAEDLSGPEREMTLRHEIVHALQDQHYDLQERLRYGPDLGDAQSALHALAEGDATAAMLDDQLLPQGLSSPHLGDDELAERMSESFAREEIGVPGVLKRSAIAPYVDGLLFVNELRRSGGWAAVDAAWRKPPATSEQLLHPDKYASAEPGRAIAPTKVSPECVLVYQDVLGEQAIRIIVEEWTDRQGAAQVASGWDGDRIVVASCPQGTRLDWRIAFDSAEDAAEAREVFSNGFGACREGQPVRLVKQAAEWLHVGVIEHGRCADRARSPSR